MKLPVDIIIRESSAVNPMGTDRQVIIVGPTTWARPEIQALPKTTVKGPLVGAHQIEYEARDLDGTPMVMSRFMPELGPRPSWWRRWFLGEKQKRQEVAWIAGGLKDG